MQDGKKPFCSFLPFCAKSVPSWDALKRGVFIAGRTHAQPPPKTEKKIDGTTCRI